MIKEKLFNILIFKLNMQKVCKFIDRDLYTKIMWDYILNKGWMNHDKRC